MDQEYNRQIIGETDILIANAVLNYDVQPINQLKVLNG